MKELIKLGSVVGTGQFRTVHAIFGHNELVAKFERMPMFGRFPHNEREWDLWLGMKLPRREHFAPCYGIISMGRILIMARTQPLLASQVDLIPADMPDRHIGNYGWFKGRLVCHDYASLVS